MYHSHSLGGIDAKENVMRHGNMMAPADLAMLERQKSMKMGQQPLNFNFPDGGWTCSWC